MEYQKPSVTTDILIFTIRNLQLNVLLVKRNIEPFKNMWAIPGGFVNINESLEQAAMRELVEETNVTPDYLEQLYTFGDLNRDPRGRVITVAYFALIKSDKIELKASTDVSNAEWLNINNLPELAFDHEKILEYAIKRLRWKFEYTTIAFSMLPERFTLSDLQKTYEIIFDKPFDKRNFRKKIFALNLVKPTKEIEKNVQHRPSKLYEFKGKIGEIIEII